MAVKKGEKDSVALTYESDMSYVSTNGEDLSNVTKKIQLPKSVTAPVKKGDTVGKVTYYSGEKELGHINILYADSVKHAAFADYFLSLLQKLFLLA